MFYNDLPLTRKTNFSYDLIKLFLSITGNSRLRQRRGQIAGLHNFGQTCFLNTLLQALAACPQFIAWLQLYNNATPDRKSLISSLLNTLEVINGTHTSLRGDPYSPGAVLRALNSLGWVIPEEEHDAHELFHIMLSTLEEEAHRPKQVGSLSDALPLNDSASDQPNRPSSAMLSDFLNTEYDEATGLSRMVRSEAHTPDSPASICDRDLHADHLSSSSPPEPMDIDLISMPMLAGGRPSRSREALNKRSSGSCRSLERLTRGPGKVSVSVLLLLQQIFFFFFVDFLLTLNNNFRFGLNKCQRKYPIRFRERWVHKLFVMVVDLRLDFDILKNFILSYLCTFQSTVRYDKFDSVTLNLPSQRRSGLSLGHLLSDYITSEDVNGVKCESCNETTTHTKSLTFAKLPACLCIHIARTVWLPTGQVCKRQDYVHFPESLSMAPYSFVQPHLNSQVGKNQFDFKFCLNKNNTIFDFRLEHLGVQQCIYILLVYP